MRRRNMARALLVDQTDSILMFKFKLVNSKRPATWITPGGGIETGETPADTIIREIWEETGLVIPKVPEPVHQDEVQFLKSEGYSSNSISERTFYAFRVKRFEVSKTNWTPIELESTLAESWWSIHELELTKEPLQVNFLPQLVRGVIAGKLPYEEINNTENLVTRF